MTWETYEAAQEGPCVVCGKWVPDCECPECPTCGEVGSPDCYENGHLEPAGDSVKAFCQHIGVSPVRDALRAIDSHNTEHVFLVLATPHPTTGRVQIYYHDRIVLDTLRPWARLARVGVAGIAWDGTDWEWSTEVPAGGDWSHLDRAREEFHEALAEYEAMRDAEGSEG
jgi:hypothetical protein